MTWLRKFDLLDILMVVAVAVALAAMLAGCGSDEKPKPVKSSVPTCCQGKEK